MSVLLTGQFEPGEREEWLALLGAELPQETLVLAPAPEVDVAIVGAAACGEDQREDRDEGGQYRQGCRSGVPAVAHGVTRFGVVETRCDRISVVKTVEARRSGALDDVRKRANNFARTQWLDSG